MVSRGRRLKVCFVPLRLLCCPLILLSALGSFSYQEYTLHRDRKAQERREREWRAKRAEDAVVPRDFTKALTPFTPGPLSGASKGLLSLPYEIRAIIWNYLLDRQILHLVRKERGKLGHLQCRDRGSQAWLHPPTCWGKDNGRKILFAGEPLDDGIFRGREDEENDRTDGDLMALLRSCKTM